MPDSNRDANKNSLFKDIAGVAVLGALAFGGYKGIKHLSKGVEETVGKDASKVAEDIVKPTVSSLVSHTANGTNASSNIISDVKPELKERPMASSNVEKYIESRDKMDSIISAQNKEFEEKQKIIEEGINNRKPRQTVGKSKTSQWKHDANNVMGRNKLINRNQDSDNLNTLVNRFNGDGKVYSGGNVEYGIGSTNDYIERVKKNISWNKRTREYRQSKK